MKAFLYRIFLFCIPVIIFIGGCEIYVRTMPSAYKQKRDQLIVNADSIELLILGSSSAMDGIDPNQFTLYAHNLAFGSQSIYFDRKLIEKYLSDLPRLKYVLLSLNYIGLYFDHEENRDFFYKYYYDINYNDRKFYKESVLQSFFVYTPEQTLSLLFQKRQEELVKGWRNKAGRNDEAVTSGEKNELRAREYITTVENWKGGDSVLNDLEAIISLLQSRKITPVLINYPNYSLMRSFLDPAVIERNKRIGKTLSQKYQIPYLDYFDDDSFTVEDYFNCNHLNEQGAAKLSKKINTVIMDMEYGYGARRK